MSPTKCAQCGGILNTEGNCSVCGVNQSQTYSMGLKAVTESAPESLTSRKNEKTNRPAFLFNKLTNDRYALSQSVSKIGRDQTNNISLTADHYISRHHAWVLQMQGGYYVEDLGSTNGTLLNGEILSERKQIFPGDRLTFGKTELIFVVE